MKSLVIITMTTLFVLSTPPINSTGGGIFGVGVRKVEAGPLSKRLESKHAPSPHSQANVSGMQSQMQGGLDEDREKCIEMLHRGDHEGAQNCIDQLQSGGSGETQPPAAEPQAVQASSPPSVPASDVQGTATGAQDANYDAREKCAEMLRGGDHLGARRCIQQLRQ